MNDAARFALAVAAILSATALDAEQGLRQSSYGTDPDSAMVRSRDDAPTSTPAIADPLAIASDGAVSLPESSDHPTLRDELDPARKNRRIGNAERSRWIADTDR